VVITDLEDNFPGYENVEKKIEESDCILAIVDKYWTSSTWKCSELTFATRHTSVGTLGNTIKKAIPVFVVPIPSDFDLKWIKQPFITILPSQCDKAVQIIKNKLVST